MDHLNVSTTTSEKGTENINRSTKCLDDKFVFTGLRRIMKGRKKHGQDGILETLSSIDVPLDVFT